MFRGLSGSYEGKIKFAKVNVDDFPQISEKYGVMNLPTIKFFCAGRPVGEIVGYMPEDSLAEEFGKMLKIHRTCVDQSSPVRG